MQTRLPRKQAPELPPSYGAALQTLVDSKLRITSARRAILVLLSTYHGPFTAEEVHEGVSDNGCDLVTVYRTLTAFEELGIVRRCDFGDGAYRYEINDPKHHHHHIICRKCGGVRSVDLCVAGPLEKVASDLGYHNISHSLEIFGTCPKCPR